MRASSVISYSFIIPHPVAHWLSLRGNQETLRRRMECPDVVPTQEEQDRWDVVPLAKEVPQPRMVQIFERTV